MMDRIRNQEFTKELRVAPISAKTRENRLRWFEHVQRMTFDASVRKIESLWRVREVEEELGEREEQIKK